MYTTLQNETEDLDEFIHVFVIYGPHINVK